MQFLPLPAYRPAGPLDFSGLAGAFDNARRSRLAEAGLQLQRDQFGLQRDQFGLQQEKFGLEKREADRTYQNALAREALHKEVLADPRKYGITDATALNALRLGGAEEAARNLLQGYQTTAQVESARAAAAASRGSEARQAALHPGALQQQGIQTRTLQRELDSPAGRITPLPDGGSAIVVDPRTGEYRTIQSPTTKLSDGDKEAVREADLVNQQGRAGMRTLQEAIELSGKAWSGPTSGARGVVTGMWGPGAGQNTQLLQNMITENALGQMKAIFGSNPTEGERKILLDVAGSVNQPHEVRVKIWRRAQQAINDRLLFNEQRAQQIRAGTYYRPGEGGGNPAAGTQASPPERTLNGRRYVKQNGQWYDAGPAAVDNDL